MGLFSRDSRASKAGRAAAATSDRSARAETLTHLGAFVASHLGCEAYIEPPTRVTETTMVVVAETGEWTRRRVPDEATAAKVAKHLGIPAYNVNLSGYPSQMREWNERQRKSLG
jgi:hypothetical protein